MTTYLVLPYYRRYASYIPLHGHMQSLNTQTRGVWHTGLDAVVRWIARSWVRIRHPAPRNEEADGEEQGALGEGMVPFSTDQVERERRRQRERVDSGARLSRELEEGFMDDSDDDREWVSQI